MIKGKVEKAERLALYQFDKWNDVTGLIDDDSGYYHEIQSVITDGVHIGIQMALYGKVSYDDDGEVVYTDHAEGDDQ